MAERKKQSFVEGAAVLTASTILVKILGALFKLPLANIIGDAGMADFGTAYNVYSLLLNISTAGLPVAMSRMISEADALGRQRQVQRTFHVARAIFFTLGMLSTLFMFLLCRQLADFLNEPDATASIAALAPAVVFVCLTSSYRGYTQGHSNMVPTSVSQIIETACKLLFGLTLAAVFIKTGKGSSMGAAGGILGVTIGTVLALLYIVLYTLRFDRGFTPAPDPDIPDSRGRTLAKLVSIGVPITLGSCILTLVALLDNKMIMGLLQSRAGFSYEMSRIYYGVYFNSQTLYNLPSAFAVPLVTSAIPVISAYVAQKLHHEASRILAASLKLMNLLSLPMGIGMGVLASPLMHGLYPNSHESGAAILAILSVASYFVCLTMVTNALLQAYGHEWLPMLSMAIGGVCKIIVNYVLLSDPNVGILGAAVGNVVCYFVISACNLFRLKRKVAVCPKLLPLFFRPLIAALLMGGCAWGVSRICDILLKTLGIFQSGRLASLIPAFAAAAVGFVLYVLLIAVLKAVSREELELVPKGDKIAKLFRL